LARWELEYTMKKGGIFDGPNALGLYSDALGETYTIKSGDFLDKIAKKYGHTGAELCSHNKSLGNIPKSGATCGALQPGDVIDIPDEWLGKAAEKKGATTGSQTPQNTMGPSDQPATQQGGGAAQPSGPSGPTSLAQKQTIFPGLPDVALYAIGAAIALGVVFVMLKKPKKPQGPSVVVQAAANRRRARRNAKRRSRRSRR
jgi:hypothetical protein